MADSTNPNANNSIGSSLIPAFYRTDANKKFIQSTIDQLVNPGTVKKVNGFIGRQYSKATTGSDIFVEAADSLRQHYQLEPGLVVKDKLGNVTFFKDYIDYINQLNVFGANTSNHAKLNQQEFYSWDPHIDWDKFSNFQNYYWLPYGPETIKIQGQKQIVSSTYKVDLQIVGADSQYVFTPDGLTPNPLVKLYRGQTYTFVINSPGNPFSLMIERATGTGTRYVIGGIDAQGVEQGTIIFQVPVDAPSILFYQSETDINLGGAIEIFDITDETYIDVESEILGKLSYTFIDGTHLSNGMKVSFAGNVTPASYSSGEYYVEGVGSGIKLINKDVLEVVNSYSVPETILFDSANFDTEPFSDSSGFAKSADYITINRASQDHNPWTRYNRWFHIDVITASFNYNKIPVSIDQNARATRPIIEFEAGLKLYNFGTTATVDVDLIDNFTYDVFSTIEGSTGYNIDGVALTQNQKILFTGDPDTLVNGKIFQVNFLNIEGSIQIHLVEIASPVFGQTVLVKSGSKNLGLMYWYNGTAWIKTQQKNSVNQPPLFDVIDNTGTSFSDTTAYPGTTFVGTPIFSYKVDSTSSVIDTKLGFALTYKNINNIGDIVFNFDYATDEFQYKVNQGLVTKSVSLGFLSSRDYRGNIVFKNGWQISLATNVQAAIRVYKNSNLTNNFNIDIFDNLNDLNDLAVKIYIDGDFINPSNYKIVDGPVYKKVVLNSNITSSQILTIKAFASQPINSNGFYEIPLNLQNNPLNGVVTTFTLGEVSAHVKSIVENLSNFQGSFPGASNLRDLGNITPYATKFIQHSGPASLSIYHVANESNNIIKAIEKSRYDYSRFKKDFVASIEKLGVDADPKTQVDLVLQKLNANKSNKDSYYFSDMVPYGASIDTSHTVADYRIKSYPLTSVFSLDSLSNKSVLVYLNGTQLLNEIDYVFNNQGFVTIQDTVTMRNGDVLKTIEYDNTDGSMVPETPTKLGIWPKFQPKMFLDRTLVNPVEVIQGHDGSIIKAYGDYRDAVLLELEKRIFNNIKIKYDTSIWDIADVIPTFKRQLPYSLENFNQALAPSFYSWASQSGFDIGRPVSFDNNNSFTYNYRGYSSLTDGNVPGYWRGVYRWMYDTDRPNICPWEMLGFSIEPSWWQSLYGPAPYTSDNIVMWTDISTGTVRTPGSTPTVNSKYIKPFLLNHLPVDESGNLVSPIFSGVVRGLISQKVATNFVFGDVGPVESTWRRSSHYPFSVLLASILLTPAKTFGLLFDRSRIARDMSGQLVYTDTGLRISPDSLSLPSVITSDTRVSTAGIVNYLVNYISGTTSEFYNEYKYNLQHLSAQLSYRVGAFTGKEKFNLLLNSKSPSNTGNIFIPQEDYDIILNSSSPIQKLTYSGIVISKLTDGFEVKGYSQTKPYFISYPWSVSGNLVNVGGISESFQTWNTNSQYQKGDVVLYGNSYYRVLQTISSGLVFESQNYSKMASLPIIGGANAYFRKMFNKNVQTTVPYGTKFTTIQDVVDFILGYGEYLKDQGFIFDDFNSGLSAVANWETSAREFMFWSIQNWSTGQDKWADWQPNTSYPFGSILRINGEYYKAIRTVPAVASFPYDDFVHLDGLSTIGSSAISLSPSANKISFTTKNAVVDSITNGFNQYEIYKVDATALSPNFINFYRQDNSVSYGSRTSDGIYGASFYLVQKEHVVILNNTTRFNDIIYSPETGYKQDKIKVSSYVSSDWTGGLNIPGFIFDEAAVENWLPYKIYYPGDLVKQGQYYFQANPMGSFVPASATLDTKQWQQLKTKPSSKLIPNWTYKAGQFTDFYNLNSDNFDVAQQRVAQHLIGYQKRQYLENIIQNDVSEFKFYQGMIREKGTQNVLNKLFDVLSSENKESLKFYEEWALRVGQYGASGSFENIEFVLDEALFKNNPQGFELVNSVDSTKYDFIIRQTPNDVYVKPLGYTSKPFPIATNYTPILRSAGYVRSSDVFKTLTTIDDIVYEDITQYTNGSYVWCTFEKSEWNIYRFTDVNLIVTDVTYDDTIKTLTIVTRDLVTLTAGTYIGISQVTGFPGFYKITSVSLNNIIIKTEVPGFLSPFLQQDTITIYALLTQRASSVDNIDSIVPRKLKENELLWTDDDGSGKWAVWKYNSVFAKKEIPNTSPAYLLSYGRSIAIRKDGYTVATSTNDGIVITYDKSSVAQPWIQRQTIQKPYVEPYNFNYTKDFATVIAFSTDGSWLATGSPNVGQVYTRLSTHNAGLWDSAYDAYTTGTIVYVLDSSHNRVYYEAISTLAVPVSTPVNNILYWREKSYVAIDYQGHTSGITLQGVVSLYQRDANNNYILVDTIVSPYPAQGELFGSSLVFGQSTLFIGAPGYNGGVGRVYEISYLTKLRATSSYNPVGSSGTTIVLTSTAGISSGMIAQGTGLTDNQTVIEVLADGKTLKLSGIPNATPSGNINFVTVGWSYVLSNTKTGRISSRNFGTNVSLSTDESKLAISSTTLTVDNLSLGTVDIYSGSINQVITGNDSSFGQSISLSSDGAYLIITDSRATETKTNQGAVYIYRYDPTTSNYGSYVGTLFVAGTPSQELINHQPEVSGYFGNTVSFMDDDNIAVFSLNESTVLPMTFDSKATTFDKDSTAFVTIHSGSGRIDIYTRYVSNWVYSETLDSDNVAGDGYGTGIAVSGNHVFVGAPSAYDVLSRVSPQAIQVGNRYQIVSLGTTDWNTVAGTTRVRQTYSVGDTFIAVATGSGNGIVSLLTRSGKIYSYDKKPNSQSWNIIHRQIDVPDVTKIKKAFLYNRNTNQLVTYIDVVDPLQGKIPGIAEEEIKYKAFYDPAIYSQGDSLVVTVDSTISWGSEHVGQLWWDLRTAKFINIFEDDVVYRNSNYSTLAHGASIDIYEWVSSSLLPEAWDALADTTPGLAQGISGQSLYGNSSYSISQRYDTISQSFKNTYYFWVKNKTIVPNISGRNISAGEVSSVIANPRGQGYKFVGLTSSNSFSIVNAKNLLAGTDIVLSLEYWLTEKTNQNVHSEWKIISEDPTTELPIAIEQKWFDSLCGKDTNGRQVPDVSLPVKLRYGIENRPRQGMFVNRFEALKQVIEQANLLLINRQIVNSRDITDLESFDPIPSTVTGSYDLTKDTDAELIFANTGAFKRPSLSPQIVNGRIVGVTINQGGQGYLVAPFIEFIGTGEGASARATLSSTGKIIGVTILSQGIGYTDSTTCSIRDYSVLVLSDSQADGSWSIYSYDPDYDVWSRTKSKTYDVTKYWSKVDWFDTGYNQFIAPDYLINTFAELNSIDPSIGQLVKVKYAGNGWEVLYRYAIVDSNDWTTNYQVVAQENGTIQFNSSLYNFSNTGIGYDASTYDGVTFDTVASLELRIILTAFRNKIFIGELKSSYLNLFFTSIRYVLSEQNYVDWIFKSSFVKAQHNVGQLNQPVNYLPDNLSNFQDYVNEVKPYRTVVREYVSSYDAVDNTQTAISDFDLPPAYEQGSNRSVLPYIVNDAIVADDTNINVVPWKNWLDNIGFEVLELQLVSGGSGYITQPAVKIISSSGTGASGIAFVTNGSVSRVILLTSGSGYLSAPTVIIDGGLQDGGTPARAVAYIGNAVVRTNLINIKFDRLNYSYTVADLAKTETLAGDGVHVQFNLIWAPDVRVGNTTVTINDVIILRDFYKLSFKKSTAKGYTTYSGLLTFNLPSGLPPAKGDKIVITYLKDWNMLSAADRIQFYYNPEVGDIGKDIKQLMTGIDYGGVNVNSFNFDVSSGWGTLPYYSDKWDTFSGQFNDYVITVPANTHTFNLQYAPPAGTLLNVYYTAAIVDTHNSDGSQTVFTYSFSKVYSDVTPTITVAISHTTATPTTTTNHSGQYYLKLTSVSGIKVGDVVTSVSSYTDAFAYNVKVKEINVSTNIVLLDQILYLTIPVSTAITFTRTLAIPTDAYVYGDGKFSLTEPAPAGSVITIIGRSGTIRLDDPDYGTQGQVNQDAIFNTPVADGTSAVFVIPPDFTVNDGDTFTWRSSTSDGSLTPQSSDFDTVLDGGNLAYSTATGVLADDIIVDGDGFVTPTTSPAPEEVVPGQVVDTLAIKVFDQPSTGSANIKIDNYIADGSTNSYLVTQIPNSPQAVIVKINNNILTQEVDYTFDYRNQTINLTTTPAIDSSISIFTIGYNGSNILDIDHFVGDGVTAEFITRAPWLSSITSLVYIDGISQNVELFKTDSTYTTPNFVGIKFTSEPARGALISFIIVAGNQQSFAITKKEKIIPNGSSYTYTLSYPVGDNLPNETNMIVRVDQNILQGPINSYFNIKNNKLSYTIDPTRFVPYSVSVNDIKVLANGIVLTRGKDYSVDLAGITVKINKTTYSIYKNTELIIAVQSSSGYSYNPTTREITFKQQYNHNQVIEVISSYKHDILDIQRTAITITSSLQITQDTVEYFNYKEVTSGIIPLDRPVINDNYVWVLKNSTLLVPGIDYKLNDDFSSVTLAIYPDLNDQITLITFGSNVITSGIAYMQFKDMLNRVIFKRLSASKRTRLLADLNYNDITITVENASGFDLPNPAKNKPGIIMIRGERIEYFSINGNVLGQIRRGTLGTGIPVKHNRGAIVQEIGPSETIPYTEKLITEQIRSTGSNTISTGFVPGGFDTTWTYKGSSMTISDATNLASSAVEVFAGGYSANVEWTPLTFFSAGTLISVGEYTYTVLIDHTSGLTFSSNVTTYSPEGTVLSASAAPSTVYQFFIGNIRLKKQSYAVHNLNVAPYSPEGDVTLPADFTVDGTTPAVQLNTVLPYGTLVTVVKRVGVSWDSNLNIQQDSGEIGRFLRATPGVWYVDEKQQPLVIKSVYTFDSTEITWDNTNIQFTVGTGSLASSFDSSGSFDANDITFDQGI
jgi:hypothetical protein